MRCGDCKFLGDEITDEEWNGDIPITIKGIGFFTCKGIKAAGMDNDLVGLKELSATVDGSGYFSAIRVKEDFGCVNFKEKE